MQLDARNQQAGACGTGQSGDYSVGVWAFRRGTREKGWPRTSFAFSSERRRASWQPSLLTCSSTTRSAGRVHPALVFASRRATDLRGKRHTHQVDCRSVAATRVLPFATAGSVYTASQQSPANYIVDDVIHLSPLAVVYSSAHPGHYPVVLYISSKPLLRLSTGGHC